MIIMNQVTSFLETQAYYIQQNIYQLLSSELKNGKPYTFILLIIGGLITSLNPCFISIIPVIVSYINYNKKEDNYRLMVITGLVASLITILTVSIILNDYYKIIILNIPIFTSLIVIIIGLNLLSIVNSNFFGYIFLSHNKLKNNANISNFFLGFIFGLSSCSCSTPILASLIIWLYNSNNFLLSIIYIIFYIIGYIIPIIILISITNNYNNITKLSQLWNYVMPFSGSIVLGIGIFSFLENIFYIY
ncbi:cytochrome c biogenesis protein transmembrane region (plastid) [Chondrus crispus]|uniref:Cytochrome c biogenesis protein transmembrane region n=1 Tax=Chondrus crispus TaxID=2769 RepID=M5DBL1_CHOCR|nr:cytochrome c biogenesis protein transmembrane region [Chondrus crispus]CCP38062.1 cytochrome c biogenesis protein transmembrane region [Chondrus crispus]|eukprot:YP_007627315.1 cytochrome c biogenesis protein transmembrane region (plastid) [Chondrus crispus]